MDQTTPPPAAPAPSHRAARPRRCNADYRWTLPKVAAFLGALAESGLVSEAAAAVGMSRQSAYVLRARLSGAEFQAAFEGARAKGLIARAATRATSPPSPWEGPGMAELERRFGGAQVGAQVGTPPAQADKRARQADTSTATSRHSDAQADTMGPKPTDRRSGTVRPVNTPR